MYEHTEYVLYTGASMHEPVAAHTLTNIVELIAHTRLSFMGSNTIADMQQTVLHVQYDGCSMCLHVHKMFYYMQKIQLSKAHQFVKSNYYMQLCQRAMKNHKYTTTPLLETVVEKQRVRETKIKSVINLNTIF